MYVDSGGLVVSPSDLVGFLACEHFTTLSGQVAGKKRAAAPTDDAEFDVLTRRGLEHEAAWLAALHQRGLTVAEVPDNGVTLTDRVHQTEAALRSGADVIFQGTFLDRSNGVAWRGHADFLHRVECESDLGSFSYEPADTKLARHVKPSALLQLCSYAEQLARLQGVAPEQVHVVLGGQKEESFRVSDFAAYYRAVKRQFLAHLAAGAETYPAPVPHCGICAWSRVCEKQWWRDDHLSLVAGLGGEQTRKLNAAGIATVVELANAADEMRPLKMGVATFSRLRRQARLQVEARIHKSLPYELLAFEKNRGLGALPPPAAGDLFLDLEGDPFVGDTGLEYLFGLGWIEGGEFCFKPWWAHDSVAEKKAFEDVVDFIIARLDADPDLHVYHYAPYERTAFAKLMGKYATREDEVDRLLRGEVFVDLYQVVRQGIAIGTGSYSIKKLEPLYMPARTGEITDAGSSIVEYERWLQTSEQAILDAIEAYNKDDVESTWLLRNWLEERRAELESASGESLSRPAPLEGDASQSVSAEVAEIAALAEQLFAVAAADDPADPHWLLAHLLDWHRREDKPEWWMYFHRLNHCTDEDLFVDSEAIAGLTYVGVAGQEAKSLIHRYSFDPEQEYKLRAGDSVVDPATEKSPGIIVDVDMVSGTIDLKRGKNSEVPHPYSIIPSGPVTAPEQRASLRRLARRVLQHGMNGTGPDAAARDLLAGRSPRVAGVPGGEALRREDESVLDAGVRLGLHLDRSYLPVQGPPGTGKTYTGARMMLALIEAGHCVGLTANSHSVIGNMLEEVMKEARARGLHVRALQKSTNDQRCSDQDVDCAKDNATVFQRLAAGEVDLVAGTGWLFSREEMQGQLHTLFVDEAGQLSLANTLAVAPAAQNLVLLGDPRQLAQPSKGTHPPGVGASALEHVLGEHETLPPERGLFLDMTWRMHPNIAGFVSEVIYEDRLDSVEACHQQEVQGDGYMSGSGIRWLPVVHEGSRTSSIEEVEEVAAAIKDLVGRTWTNEKGITAPLGHDDILVVAPYNAQVALLGQHLPEGVQVGTVDKFQGKEAAVTIVSLSASSAHDVPRGMEFLYSLNRLNVAVSRARAMSIVVGSPKLLTVRCRTPHQMRLANALCRLVEVASDGAEDDGAFQTQVA